MKTSEEEVPKTADGKTDWSQVEDERCQCQHLKSEHHDRPAAPGHGGCAVMSPMKGACNCDRYTFKEFLWKGR